MRTCGACKQPLRWDESLGTCYLSDGAGGAGYYKACPRCFARAVGAEPSAPRIYPTSEPPPRHPYRDDYLPICGMCRVALFEGERCKRIRLQVSDVAGSDTEAGGYHACPRCIAFWRARLGRVSV